MPTMLQIIPTPTIAQPSHEMSFGYQALSLHILWKRIQRHIRFEATHPHTYRRKNLFLYLNLIIFICQLVLTVIYSFRLVNNYLGSAVQMQSMRKIVHTTLFTRITLFESARCSASVCIQRASHKGTYGPSTSSSSSSSWAF